MPNVEDVRISYASNVAAVAGQDAAAMEKLADAAEVTDRVIKKTSQTADSVQRSNDAVDHRHAQHALAHHDYRHHKRQRIGAQFLRLRGGL